ncbi:MAG: ribosome biogenesis GTPase Der [Dehalococcoidia bacterium]|nr:ribosome biogenesis GTPase Der [Dehalococcoidia bacterium]
MAEGKPIVAIVGRQNVGKSTLLNRMVGRRLAIVEDSPGTTRDRVIASVSWHDAELTVVDTGGLEFDARSAVAHGVQEQIEAAITVADVIIFLADVKSGVIAADVEMADRLRRVEKPVLLVVNKVDNEKLEAGVVEFYQLGLGEPVAISAYHGRGTAELLDRIVALVPAPALTAAEPELMKIAIAGRTNVGKSMLLNALVGEKRAIVDDAPGTTRDATDTTVDFDGQSVLLIDTAGIRKRGRIERGVEQYSVLRALRAIDRADVVLLVLDAMEIVTAQDTHIAGFIQQAAKGVVAVVNKWDLVDNKDLGEWDRYLRSQFKFMAYAPLIYISAKYGEGVDRVIPEARQVYEQRGKRPATAEVNNVVQQAVAAHILPRKGHKRLKIFYATQAEVNPPTFIFFVNDAKLVHFSYHRYLESRLRQAFGFTGTPLRLIFRTRGEEP